jgi:hypothetical protein
VDNFTSPTARQDKSDSSHINVFYTPTMKPILTLTISLFLLVLPTSAQFQFFEHVFGGGGHQQQQPQNMGSDSAWYQQQYEAGPSLHSHPHPFYISCTDPS